MSLPFHIYITEMQHIHECSRNIKIDFKNIRCYSKTPFVCRITHFTSDTHIFADKTHIILHIVRTSQKALSHKISSSVLSLKRPPTSQYHRLTLYWPTN